MGPVESMGQHERCRCRPLDLQGDRDVGPGTDRHDEGPGHSLLDPQRLFRGPDGCLRRRRCGRSRSGGRRRHGRLDAGVWCCPCRRGGRTRRDHRQVGGVARRGRQGRTVERQVEGHDPPEPHEARREQSGEGGGHQGLEGEGGGGRSDGLLFRDRKHGETSRSERRVRRPRPRLPQREGGDQRFREGGPRDGGAEEGASWPPGGDRKHQAQHARGKCFRPRRRDAQDRQPARGQAGEARGEAKDHRAGGGRPHEGPEALHAHRSRTARA